MKNKYYAVFVHISSPKHNLNDTKWRSMTKALMNYLHKLDLKLYIYDCLKFRVILMMLAPTPRSIPYITKKENKY